jgi:hypothetical protein
VPGFGRMSVPTSHSIRVDIQQPYRPGGRPEHCHALWAAADPPALFARGLYHRGALRASERADLVDKGPGSRAHPRRRHRPARGWIHLAGRADTHVDRDAVRRLAEPRFRGRQTGLVHAARVERLLLGLALAYLLLLSIGRWVVKRGLRRRVDDGAARQWKLSLFQLVVSWLEHRRHVQAGLTADFYLHC